MTQRLVIYCGAALFAGLLTSRACAQFPTDQSTQTMLARAMVYEGGWLSGVDHRAVAHALGNRWLRSRRTYSFRRFIEKHCTGLSSGWPTNRRRRWVRNLNARNTRPHGWPLHLDWDSHVRYWKRAQALARRYLYGHLPDPCHGHVLSWTMSGIAPQGEKYARVSCPGARNVYYTIRRN